MIRADSDIYFDIAAMLAAAAPVGSVQMIMTAMLTPESDACRFQYDSVNDRGKGPWTRIGPRRGTCFD